MTDHGPQIISASRRTDIPRFYAAWFAERRRAGWCAFRTAFGTEGRASLRDEDVLGYLFWTRDGRPFLANLHSLSGDGIPFSFQFTVTGYDSDLERNRVPLSEAIRSFHAVRATLPDSRCIQWRYDPILFSEKYHHEYHRRAFREIASALSGATRVVNVSLAEPYKKVLAKIDDPTMRFRAVDPARHRWVSKNRPDVLRATPGDEEFLLELSQIAGEYGMTMRSCADPKLPLPSSQCCGLEMFLPYGERLMTRAGKLSAAPSRAGCRCVRSVDIGMDNTCVGGCLYCYVTTSLEQAERNFKRHDPASPMLR